MPLGSSGRVKWLPWPLSRSGASVLLTRSFLTLLGRSLMSWTPPNAVFSPPSLSGSSRALLGEYSSSFYSNHVGTRSNSFYSCFGTSLVSLTHPDATDTCALSSGDVSLELARGLPLELKALGFILCIRWSVRCWRWAWWIHRYVVDIY